MTRLSEIEVAYETNEFSWTDEICEIGGPNGTLPNVDCSLFEHEVGDIEGGFEQVAVGITGIVRMQLRTWIFS